MHIPVLSHLVLHLALSCTQPLSSTTSPPLLSYMSPRLSYFSSPVSPQILASSACPLARRTRTPTILFNLPQSSLGPYRSLQMLSEDLVLFLILSCLSFHTCNKSHFDCVIFVLQFPNTVQALLSFIVQAWLPPSISGLLLNQVFLFFLNNEFFSSWNNHPVLPTLSFRSRSIVPFPHRISLFQTYL